MINVDLINPLAEFWLLTLAHKRVFKMNAHIAGCTKGGSTEISGHVSQQEMRLVLFLALHNKKHKRKW